MKAKAIPFLAVIAGIAFLLALFLILGPDQSANLEPRVIGKITNLQGQLSHRPPMASSFTEIQMASDSSLDLMSQEQVATSQASEATITLKNGAEFRLLENSKAVAEVDVAQPGGFVVTLLEGELSIVKPGTPKIRIFKDGREVDEKNLSGPQAPKIGAELPPNLSAQLNEGLTITATSPPPELSEADPDATTKDIGAVSQGVLTNEQIIRRLKQQMSYFHRCYLNFLHRSTNQAAQTGAVVLSFTIQKSGRVTNTDIVRSDFSDSTLHQCIVEVVDRTTFSPFEGEDVPVLEFPISLQ